MKKIYVLVLSVLAVQFFASAQATITTSGFTFTPDSVVVNVGDQVTFNVNFSSHPLHEVSSTTWAANGATQLSGGFSATTGNTLTVTMTQAGTRYYVCSNHVSLGMKGRIFVNAASGISNIAAVAATTYPNPASSLLHIVTNSTGAMHCVMTDMLGQSVLDSREYASGQGIVTVDISALANGTYILSATSTDGMVSKSKVQIAR